jgi:hypothetical protein
LLSVVLLFPSLGSVFVYLNFKIHQEEIVKNLCIQRQMKENKCNGHCFLSKQLKKEAEKEKKQTENLIQKQELIYIAPGSVKTTNRSFLKPKLRPLYFANIGQPKSVVHSIFRPPLV